MKKSIKIIVAILIILMLMLATKSYAAIECNLGSEKYMNKTQEDAFKVCYDMRDPTSSLGNNNLDPHLVLNKEFGAYAYLGMSAYGSNGVRGSIKIENYNRTSTNSNATGVIFSGAQYELTAGIYDPNSVTAIIKKYGNTKYIERFTEEYNSENTKGMAILETSNWYSSPYSNPTDSNPYIFRNFNTVGAYYITLTTYGYMAINNFGQYQCFRPVIWNQ